MRQWIAVGILLLMSAVASASPTIAVYTESDQKVLSKKAFESIIWHELQQSLGHDALFVDRIDVPLVERMRREKITSLLEMSVEWKIDVIPMKDERFAGGYFPVVKTREWAIVGDQLVAQTEWTTSGTVALFKVRNGPANEVIAIPEIALQSTVEMSLQPIEAPSWKHEDSWIRVAVSAMADDEYRTFYGDQWKKTIEIRIARANAILKQAGIILDVESMDPWVSHRSATNLSQLLDQLAALPRKKENQLRIGFTQQTKLSVKFQRDIEDVGRAYLPGRDLIVADQAVPPGHQPNWDIAEEGVAIAHEVMHAFGVPHQEEPFQLMSASKVGTVHRMSEKTIALARAAASARFSHWDPTATLEALGHSAERHLDDPKLQVDYIAENFAHGNGFLQAYRLEPTRLSALSNLAVGHYYLRQALKNPGASTRLASRALAHTESALAQNPYWVPASELMEAILNLHKDKHAGISSAPETTEQSPCSRIAADDPARRDVCD